MSVKMKKAFSKEMQNLDAAGLLRTEAAVVETDNMEVRLSDNKTSLNFTGNDFLGWSSNENIHDIARDALSNYGTGSTSSRISIGTLDIHKNLEEKLSSFLGVDDCIIFQSTYLANIGLFESLTSQRDTIFIDEMCNPGLFDGVRLSRANVITYKHKDYENLEYHLKCSQNSRYRVIVTDSVFSNDGACADLVRIERLKDIYDAISVVDDSLGIGILGENGKGAFNHLKVDGRAELITASFAYALGNVSGGFVAGDKDLVNWLRRTSRSYILSEPISPINSSIVLKVIDLLGESQPASEDVQSDLEDDPTADENPPAVDDDQIVLQDGQFALESLNSNSKYLKQEVRDKKWKLIDNTYPFVSINVGSTLNAQKMVEYLFENNILVSGLCYPNTPEGSSILRMNLSANHTEVQIDKLVSSIEEAFNLLD